MSNSTSLYQIQELSADSALAMLQAARAKAGELGVAVCISVVGPQGLPLASLRMNGAPLHSIDYAANKAYTAVSFKRPTHEWDQRLANQTDIKQALASHPRMLMLGGGLPVQLPASVDANTPVIGAVGVSGASVQQDIECAEAAVSAALQPAACSPAAN
ncbi:GlcG/HbpS family heme-binding protein [Oceanobacter mangrovi]|uniref:GlcG/HbpS family heme-binding protein n=1 Tax=Oceanobacter mangrovi TaxID=2862510 RepID=UPI001C8D5CF4|nr:heme-binding protein [Oceanobacter mangrovi]